MINTSSNEGLVPFDIMRPGDKHCGPVALNRVTGIPTASIMAGWPESWDDRRKDTVWGFWPIDTPWLHRKYIERVLGRHMRSCLQDTPFPAKSIALLHLHKPKDSYLRKLWSGLWNQHWVTVLFDDGQRVTVDWGDGTLRTFHRQYFLEMVNLMWPRCIYTIEETVDLCKTVDTTPNMSPA